MQLLLIKLLFIKMSRKVQQRRQVIFAFELFITHINKFHILLCFKPRVYPIYGRIWCDKLIVWGLSVLWIAAITELLLRGGSCVRTVLLCMLLLLLSPKRWYLWVTPASEGHSCFIHYWASAVYVLGNVPFSLKGTTNPDYWLLFHIISAKMQ